MTEKEQTDAANSRIPAFKTVEEEASFWDTHSSEEFADELTLVDDVQFVKVNPRKEFI